MKAKATAILAAAVILAMTACGKTDAPSEISAQSTESLTESTSVPTSEDLSFLDGELVGSVIVLNDGRGLQLYGGSYDNGREYAATLGEYKQRLGENVNVYSMVIPTAAAFYLPEKYYDEGAAAREPPHIDDINAHLSGVIPIDVYSALKDHTEEEIYLRTDHHWTQLGSYYAAQSFAKTAQVSFDEFSEYDRHEQSGFHGSLYGAISDSHIESKCELFVWYVPKREVTTIHYDTKCENGVEESYFRSNESYYMVYAGGSITQVSTGLDTERRLMIIGDSFPWSIVPFLFGSFDEIWFVDYRGCEISAVGLAEDKGITDLLFCSSINTATTDSQKMFSEIM